MRRHLRSQQGEDQESQMLLRLQLTKVTDSDTEVSFRVSSDRSAQRSGLPFFSLARRKASAKGLLDCASGLRGAEEVIGPRELSRGAGLESFLPVSSSSRSVRAMRLRATSTSSTFTLTMSPG